MPSVHADAARVHAFPDVYPDECPESPLSDYHDPADWPADRAPVRLSAAPDGPSRSDWTEPTDEDLLFLVSQRAVCRALPETLAELDRRIAAVHAYLIDPLCAEGIARSRGGGSW